MRGFKFRVNANGAVGIPNAKISIFIPVTDDDKLSAEIRAIYPYENPRDKNVNGKRYNLLPRVAQVQTDGTVRPKQPFRSFPTKEIVVTKAYKDPHGFIDNSHLFDLSNIVIPQYIIGLVSTGDEGTNLNSEEEFPVNNTNQFGGNWMNFRLVESSCKNILPLHLLLCCHQNSMILLPCLYYIHI